MTILPEALKKEFMTYKQSIDLNTPVLTQGTLEIYLKSSMYPVHVARTRKFFQKKMEELRKACLNGFAALEGIRVCVCNCTDEELERAVKRIKEEMSAIAAGLP